jgi:hypothetical protein
MSLLHNKHRKVRSLRHRIPPALGRRRFRSCQKMLHSQLFQSRLQRLMTRAEHRMSCFRRLQCNRCSRHFEHMMSGIHQLHQSQMFRMTLHNRLFLSKLQHLMMKVEHRRPCSKRWILRFRQRSKCNYYKKHMMAIRWLHPHYPKFRWLLRNLSFLSKHRWYLTRRVAHRRPGLICQWIPRVQL